MDGHSSVNPIGGEGRGGGGFGRCVQNLSKNVESSCLEGSLEQGALIRRGQ